MVSQADLPEQMAQEINDDQLTIGVALKRKSTLLDRIKDRISKVRLYCARVSVVNTTGFKNDEDQKKEVEAAIQSAKDLFWNRINLQKNIMISNLLTKTSITIDGRQLDIADLILLKQGRGGGNEIDLMLTLFNALDASRVEIEARRFTVDNKPAEVLKFYDEKYKLQELEKWNTLKDSIQERLEGINNLTPLIEYYK